AAIVTFQSVWILSLLVAAIAVALFGAVVLLQYVTSASSDAAFANSLAIFLIIAYSAAILQSRVIVAGFRSTGHYARGVFLYEFLAFIEGLSVLVVAVGGGGFVACALALLIGRCLSAAIGALTLKRLVPWLSLGFKYGRGAELRRLLRPALAAIAIPTALAVNIQGMVVVAGALISPVAVAVLGPVRM